ncbi:ATP-binding protein [Clostridiisalibacter paucivorans]|uniref:ATP-binding protein n=1 Tax=Clostridiisalibacter paucivorans TaxID=408753 RepID=UPI00196BB154
MFITNKFILNIEIPDISVNFQFDSRLLKRAIFNIFENIIKYNSPETNVNIKFSISGDNIVINIKDDGVGISSDFYGTVKEAIEKSPYEKFEDAYLWYTDEEVMQNEDI